MTVPSSPSSPFFHALRSDARKWREILRKFAGLFLFLFAWILPAFPCQAGSSNDTMMIKRYIASEIARTGGEAKFVLFLLVSFLSSFVAIWIASRIVAGKEGTFLKSIAYWLISVVIIVLLVVAAVVGIILAIAFDSEALMNLAMILVVVTALVALFLIPMKLYDIGFLRALGLIVISIVLSFLAKFGLEAAFFPEGAPMAELAGMSHSERKEFLQDLRRKELEAQINGTAGKHPAEPAPAPTLQQRYDEIRLLHSRPPRHSNKPAPGAARYIRTTLSAVTKLYDAGETVPRIRKL